MEIIIIFFVISTIIALIYLGIAGRITKATKRLETILLRLQQLDERLTKLETKVDNMSERLVNQQTTIE